MSVVGGWVVGWLGGCRGVSGCRWVWVVVARERRKGWVAVLVWMLDVDAGVGVWVGVGR